MEKDFPDLLDQLTVVSLPDGHQDLHQHLLPCRELLTAIQLLCDLKFQWFKSLAWIAKITKVPFAKKNLLIVYNYYCIFQDHWNNWNLNFPSVFSVFNLWNHYFSVFLFLRTELLIPSLICQYDLIETMYYIVYSDLLAQGRQQGYVHGHVF